MHQKLLNKKIKNYILFKRNLNKFFKYVIKSIPIQKLKTIDIIFAAI